MESTVPATGLSAGQVCLQLGLVPSTLRAWNRRYGIGPTGHQAGRHRYYDRSDVAAVARMQSLIAAGTPPVVAAGIVTRGQAGASQVHRVPRTARGLRSSVLRLDGAAVSAALREGMARGGPLHVWHRLYRPVMDDIGRQVVEQGHCLEAERLLSWAATAALHMVPQVVAATRPRVVLACAQGEDHCIGLEVVRAVLAERGVATVMLGADTPQAGLEAAVRVTARPFVVLAAQTTRTARPARLARVQRVAADAEVVAAGPGWSPVNLPAGLHRADSVEQVLALVESALQRD